MFTADQFEVHRFAPRLRWALTRLAYQYAPALATAALQMESAGLVAPMRADLISRDLVQVPPALNEDMLDLFGQSEKILSNHFTFLNRSRKLPENIDWEPQESAAWRADLHAFDYGLDLALYFRISGEERYARHLRYLMAHWIGANPPGQGSGWELAPLARRVRNWILASDFARDNWGRNADFFSLVTRSLALQVTFLLRHASCAIRTDDILDCAAALHLAGKFFDGGQGNTLRAAGRRMLCSQISNFKFEISKQISNFKFEISNRQMLCSQISNFKSEISNSKFEITDEAVESGFPRECPAEPRPSSQLRLAQALVEHLIFDPGQDAAFRQAGGADPRLSGPRLALRDAVSTLEGMLLPNGELPLFGPAPGWSVRELADVFAFAAVLLNDPVCKYLAGKFGLLPYMLLGERGVAEFKNLTDSGWKAATCLQPQSGLYRLVAAESSGIVINGRLPCSGDDHQDALTYELTLAGQRVIVDSGAYTPGDDANDFSASARAHNVLLVNGQAPRYGSPPELTLFPQPQPAIEGTLSLQLAHRGFAFLGVEHQRAWFSLGESAWAVLDRLDGAAPRAVTSLIHFYPTFAIELRNDRAIVQSRSLILSVVPLRGPAARPNEGSKPKMSSSRGDDPEFPGWYAPEFGVRHPASVLRFEWPRATLPRLCGYVIALDADWDFAVSAADGRSVAFRLGVKHYHLRV